MERVFDSYRGHIREVATKRKRGTELTALVATEAHERGASAAHAPRVTSGNVPIASLATPDRPELIEAYQRGLAVRQPGDRWVGCTRLRTLNALLRKIDQRGFERCVAFSPTTCADLLTSAVCVMCVVCVCVPGPPISSSSTRPSPRRARASSTRVANTRCISPP